MTEQELHDYHLNEIMRRYYNDEIVSYKADPEHAARYAAPVLSQAAPDLLEVPERDTFLWRYLEKALQSFYGNPNYVFVPQFQKEGTCAAQGTKLGQDTVAALNSILYATEFPGRFSVAANYAGSRVDIAGRPGSWQGSAGSWMAEWSEKFGCVLLKDLGFDWEEKDKDEQLGLQWCRSRDGVPSQFETLAKQRPIETAVKIGSAREAGKSIQNGNPVIHGSTLIPNGKRDSNGFSRVQRAGGHLTLFWAVRWNPFGLLYQNSWNKWGSGPKFPDDQPEGSVWVTESDADAIIAQGDAYALCGINGLKPRFNL